MKAGFLSGVFPNESFEAEVNKRVKEWKDLPPGALMDCKKLVRSEERNILHEVNRKECDLLVDRWQSKECADAIQNFMTRKRK